MNERLEAAAKALADEDGWTSYSDAEKVLAAADAPILALIAEAEARRGSSQYCLVTTYELRKALGINVDNWHDELKGAGDE